MRVPMLMALLAAAVFILSACTGPSAQEEIYEHLEKAVALEDTFREQQQPMVELEKEEQVLYEQIIDLNMDEFAQIKELSQQAAGIVEKRKEKLDLEKESIEAAKEAFDEITPLVENLGDDQAEAKDKADELVSTMNKRYEAYGNLYSTYAEALTQDVELYEMMQEEDLTEEQLQEQIEKINQSYNQVVEYNQSFNEHTEEYNTLKKELYEAMELDVTYEESSDKEANEEEKNEEDTQDGDASTDE